MISKAPNGVDRVVGQRLRWRRRELRLTQEQLGERLGLTFQQVQKYEKGINRIAAGRLYEISAELGVDISYFFDGAADLIGLPSQAVQEANSPEPPNLPVIETDAIELIQAYQAIADSGVRKSLLNAIRAAASAALREADTGPDDEC